MKLTSPKAFEYKGVVILLALFVLITAHALAQSGGDYTLTWSTIDGGGGTSAGGSYTLTGTIGQPNAGSASGGIYELLGGFWPGVSGSTVMYHPADTNNDYIISISEIVSYINKWSAGEVTISDVVKAINLWSAGHYYWDESEQRFKPGEEP